MAEITEKSALMEQQLADKETTTATMEGNISEQIKTQEDSLGK